MSCNKLLVFFGRFTDLLQLIVGGYHHHGRRDQRRDHHKGNHAHQQDLKGVIVIVYNVFHRGNIEHHLHFDGAKRAELCQVGYASKNARKYSAKTLHKGDQKRLHQLAVTNIAQTPYKEGKFGKDIAVYKVMTKSLEEVGFLWFRAGPQ